MHWKKGTSRAVLVIPGLGICLKFARVKIWAAVWSTGRDLFRGRFWLAWRYWKYPTRSSVGARRLVFRGILDNWREWRFSARLAHPVLARTYLTLGIVNVQEAAGENPLPMDPHYRRFQNIVGWRTINDSDDLHAFSQRNFGVRDGKAVVVDYASLAMQKVLAEYGDRIHNELDLVSPP